MGVYKRGQVWWYKFAWRGETIRESTKQKNKRVAEQMEAARKTQLAKGEIGLKDRPPCPTVQDFLLNRFLPFIESTKANESNTVKFYMACARNLLRSEVASVKLDRVKPEHIAAYIEGRTAAKAAVSTMNRELSTLRRSLRLANKWGVLGTSPPEIELLEGENVRERVLSEEEESAYLFAAQPTLRTFGTIILDCGLRPDEVYRRVSRQ